MSSSLQASFQVGQRVRLDPDQTLLQLTLERLGPGPYRIVDVREAPESSATVAVPHRDARGRTYHSLHPAPGTVPPPHPQQVKVTDATGAPAWDGSWITGIFFVPADN